MKRRILSSLMALVLVFGLLPATAFAAEGESTTPAVYVNDNGNDASGDGSVDKPYATLVKAVDAAADGATIYVMSDMTLTKCARYYGKHLTIIGQPGADDTDGVITVTRGDEFDTLDDTNRSWYNPAMIEVGGKTDENDELVEQSASLRLENIVLDDVGKKIGTRFLQAPVTDLSSKAIVQDAIIATYNNTATITLGDGAVLKNFGGMSAVRIADGVLVMESGSKIIDDTVTDRAKSSEGTPTKDYGAAGAVWMQGGSFTMEEGAVIENVVGRAVYADGGEAVINGTISGIKSDGDMWNGCQGVAIHLRNCATASVGGTIQNVKSTDKNSVIIRGENSSFTLEQGATIKNCEGTGESGYGGLIYMNLQKVCSQELIPSFTLNGTITECASDGTVIYTVNSSAPVLIGENAKITNNKGKRLFYENAAANFEAQMVIGGTITNNICSVLFYGSNNGRPVILTDTAKVNDNEVTSAVFGFKANRRIVMETGSEICNNKVANGAVVAVNGEGNCFTMKGGTISGNTVENGSLFAFTSGSWQQPSTLAIKGGTISNNTVSRMFTITNGGKVPGIYSYLEVSAVDSDTYFQQDGKTVTADPGTKLGNADDRQSKYAWPDQSVGQNPRCVAALNAAAANYGWNSAFATFWAQATNVTPVTVKMDSPAEGESPAFDTAKAVYALLLATDEKGAPESGAEIVAFCAKVDAEGNISFNLPGNTNGYAVALVQPTMDYGTLIIETDPSSLAEHESKDPYTVDYTATFTASENLRSMLETAKSSLSSFMFAPALDSRLTLNGSVSTPTVVENRVTWTFQATLNRDDFAAGESLFTGGRVSAMVGNTAVNVPAVPAETEMVGLCTVTFNANGGAFSDGGEEKVVRTVSGKTVAIPAAPTRSGYTFTGWNTQQDGKGSSFDNSTVITAPLTVYAQWSENSSGGGGDGSKTYYYFAIEKVDAQDGHTLNGAKFGLYLDGKQVATATSNRSGIALFRVNESDYRKINAKSDLYYQELTAPEGYVVNSDEVSIEKSNLTTSWSKAEKDAETVRNYRGTTPDLLNDSDHFAYVIGYKDGNVRPYGLISRAETTTIFFRLLKDSVRDGNLLTSNTYTDVADDYWANTAISTMTGLGIVQGRSTTTFDSKAPITRAQFAAICARFDTGKSSGEQTFSDISGHWAEKYIQRAAELGWIKGFEDGTFRPDTYITRAQAMTMINRVLNRIPEENSDLLAGMNTWPDCTPGDWFYLAVQEATNSHDFKHKAGNYETWTGMNKDPDWTRYEH